MVRTVFRITDSYWGHGSGGKVRHCSGIAYTLIVIIIPDFAVSILPPPETWRYIVTLVVLIFVKWLRLK